MGDAIVGDSASLARLKATECFHFICPHYLSISNMYMHVSCYCVLMCLRAALRIGLLQIGKKLR